MLEKLTVNTLCSGIGCQEQGIKNTGLFDLEVLATSEINKNAVVSYAAVHCGLTNEMIDSFKDYPSLNEMKQYLTDINLGYEPEKNKKYNWYQNGKKFNDGVKKYWLACKLSNNLGDVSSIEQLPKADLWFFSFPCTDISVAGKLKGLNPDDNTRSSLIWQAIRLLNVAKETKTLPKYMMLENVKNLVGKRFIHDFETFNSLIEEFGYNTYWQVINGKNCGVPQNRERVFAVYIRKDVDTRTYTFPEPFDNGLRLKDVLENQVDEKYYINTEKAQNLIKKLLDDGTIIDYNVQGAEESTQKEHIIPVYANYNKVEQIGADVARTVLSRDFKGFGSSDETSTGVIERT